MKVRTRLYIQQEMMKSISATESLVYVAGLIWGKKEGGGPTSTGGPVKQIGSVQEAQQFASWINSG